MNIKKLLCELFGKNWSCCDAYWDTIEVCRATGRRANPYCPDRESRRVRKSEIPAVCALHVAPEPPPPPPQPKFKACPETGRAWTRWCPGYEEVDEEPKLGCRLHRPGYVAPVRFILFTIIGHDRCDHSDEEVATFSERIGKAGVDFVRIFPGAEPVDGVTVAPFLRSEAQPDKYDCRLINPEWMALLQRFQRALAREGVGLMFDLIPMQLFSRDWSWWKKGCNVNDIEGIDDVRPQTLDYWKWWFGQVVDIIGKESNQFKLGNELQGPGDPNDVNTLKEWARQWAVPLARYIRDELSLAMPLSICGEPYAGTGHKIANRLINEEGWPESQLLIHLHGINLFEPFVMWYGAGSGPEGRTYSLRKFYCISDDGSGLSPENQIPADKRGVCSTRADGSKKCSANQAWRIDTVKRVSQVPGFQLSAVEWMPQSLKGDVRLWRLSDVDQEVEVDVFWRCAQDVFGVDIRRS